MTNVARQVVANQPNIFGGQAFWGALDEGGQGFRIEQPDVLDFVVGRDEPIIERRIDLERKNTIRVNISKSYATNKIEEFKKIEPIPTGSIKPTANGHPLNWQIQCVVAISRATVHNRLVMITNREKNIDKDPIDNNQRRQN